MYRAFCLASLLLAAIAAMALCQDQAKVARQPHKLAVSGLPNALQLHERVISGGEPAGEAGFAALQDLGVKTVISVDGARPDVERAAQYGLRYVHLPHGYDGVPDERARELAKAVRDLPGPIYIHCHHGKHRSPAAAAVACVAAGLLQADQAPAVLKAAGTSEHYRGLFASAAAARRISDFDLDQLAAEFQPVAKVPPMADAMVQIEHTQDRLKAFAETGWQRLANQPDLDQAHEALILKEHYRELARSTDAQQRSREFRSMLAAAEQSAERLERVLRDRERPMVYQRADAALAAVSQECTRCHQRFRDVPLSEKRR